MLESTESIDYSADSAKDLKPPHSYAQLIGMAILSTGEQQMTLNNIYKWIMANYAFYRYSTSGWQNSIRHNLSLNKAFEKIARRTDEPGKGMKWMISPKERDTF
ncbi:fork head transcription factor, partial [Aureobasidium melanogenum CBS 110374]